MKLYQAIVIVIPLTILIIFLLGLIIAFLWNNSLALVITTVGTITVLQGILLWLLVGLLFHSTAISLILKNSRK